MKGQAHAHEVERATNLVRANRAEQRVNCATKDEEHMDRARSPKNRTRIRPPRTHGKQGGGAAGATKLPATWWLRSATILSPKLGASRKALRLDQSASIGPKITTSAGPIQSKADSNGIRSTSTPDSSSTTKDEAAREGRTRQPEERRSADEQVHERHMQREQPEERRRASGQARYRYDHHAVITLATNLPTHLPTQVSVCFYVRM